MLTRILVGALCLTTLGLGQYAMWSRKSALWMVVLTLAGLALLWAMPGRSETGPIAARGLPPGPGRAARRRWAPEVIRLPGLPPPPPPKRWSVGLLVLSVVLLVAVSGALGARIGHRLAQRPALYFQPDYDFGKVLQGKVIEKNFTFKNTGEKPLEIKELRTS